MLLKRADRTQDNGSSTSEESLTEKILFHYKLADKMESQTDYRRSDIMTFAACPLRVCDWWFKDFSKKNLTIYYLSEL